MAERGEQVPGHGLVRALGQIDAGLLGEVVQVQQAVDLDLAAAQLPGLLLLDVVLVVDLADQLLDEVLERDDARGAAVLVHHDGQVRLFRPHLRQGGQHGLAPRQELHLPQDVAHQERGAFGDGAEQVAGVHEADHVVVGVLVHREPGVRRGPDGRRGLGDRRGGVQELDLGPRHQHLADLPPPGVEYRAQDVPLVRAQRLVTGHRVAELLLGHDPAGHARVAAEHPDHEVHRPGQQPDHGRDHGREPVQDRRGEQRHPLRALQREPLGGELAEDQGEERDHQRDHGDRDRGGEVVGQVVRQLGLQGSGQGGRAERAGQQGRQRHADLDRGQEQVGVLRQLGRPLAALAAPGQRPDLAVPQRDQRHLGGGEEAADEDDDQDNEDVPADGVHS